MQSVMGQSGSSGSHFPAHSSLCNTAAKGRMLCRIEKDGAITSNIQVVAMLQEADC
jgi:hypothetical protein